MFIYLNLCQKIYDVLLHLSILRLIKFSIVGLFDYDYGGSFESVVNGEISW